MQPEPLSLRVLVKQVLDGDQGIIFFMTLRISINWSCRG